MGSRSRSPAHGSIRSGPRAWKESWDAPHEQGMAGGDEGFPKFRSSLSRAYPFSIGSSHFLATEFVDEKFRSSAFESLSFSIGSSHFLATEFGVCPLSPVATITLIYRTLRPVSYQWVLLRLQIMSPKSDYRLYKEDLVKKPNLLNLARTQS